MTQITEDYVSFKTAKLLKEKGFDEATNRYYNAQYDQIRTVSDTFMWHWNNEEFVKGVLMDGAIAIPTLQMAMKWLRKVYNFLLVVDYEWECDTTPYYFKVYRLGENGKPERVAVKGVLYDKDYNPKEYIVGYRDWERGYGDYSTYEEACEAAIKYCLENLI